MHTDQPGCTASRCLILQAPTSPQFHHLKIDKEFDKALDEYTPQALDCRIDLFAFTHRFAGFTDPLYGFGAVGKKRVRLHEIACYPRATLVEPYVQQLAKAINRCIAGK